MRSIVIAVTLICLSRGAALADNPLLEAIETVKRTSPALGSELETLAKSSETAKKFLSSREGRNADPLKGFHHRQFLAYCALEKTSWSMTRCKVEYPELCKNSELLATARDEKGVHWAVFRFNGDLAKGRYYEKTGEFSASPDPFQLPFDSSWCDYDTLLDPRGDTLLVRFWPKRSADDQFRRLVTEHLIIHEGKLTRHKRVTEEYPIEKQ